MKKEILKVISPEGYEIVYISEYFFNVLEKELKRISRHGGEYDGSIMTCLRDELAMIEFRSLYRKI